MAFLGPRLALVPTVDGDLGIDVRATDPALRITVIAVLSALANVARRPRLVAPEVAMAANRGAKAMLDEWSEIPIQVRGGIVEQFVAVYYGGATSIAIAQSPLVIRHLSVEHLVRRYGPRVFGIHHLLAVMCRANGWDAETVWASVRHMHFGAEPARHRLIFFGGLAFALAQFLGRAAGAGIASFALVAGLPLVNFREAVPAFGALSQLTPWGWTRGHAAALTGIYDWPSLVPVAIAAVVLIGLGIEAFARRDIGASGSVSISRLRLPSLAIGVDGPIGRSFGERLSLTLAWGLGIGVFVLAIGAMAGSLAEDSVKSPDLLATFGRIFPTADFTKPSGWLQLFVQLLFIVAGLAAATLVSGWASDETSGRLEMLLATRLTRARWAIASGLGVFAAIALMAAFVGIGIGIAPSASDVLTPMAGAAVLGLYAAALAGIGFAVGGLVRGSWAGGVVVVTYLIDLLIPALNLPSDVRQIALTAHLGQPMIGVWDWAGVAACVVLALGGLSIGAWGFTRRVVGR